MTEHKIKVKFSFQGDAQGHYVAEVEGFPYLTEYADTYEEAYRLAEDSLRTILALLDEVNPPHYNITCYY